VQVSLAVSLVGHCQACFTMAVTTRQCCLCTLSGVCQAAAALVLVARQCCCSAATLASVSSALVSSKRFFAAPHSSCGADSSAGVLIVALSGLQLAALAAAAAVPAATLFHAQLSIVP
jgi:hypothetical protein